MDAEIKDENLENEILEAGQATQEASDQPTDQYDELSEEVLEASSEDSEEAPEEIMSADSAESEVIEANISETDNSNSTDEADAIDLSMAEGENELSEFEAAEIEEEPEKEFLPVEQLESILESLLFVSDKPLSVAAMKQVFKHTTVTTRQIKKALDALAVEFASSHRGVTLEEVSGGYRLHTKVDNMDYLKKMVRARPFKLSGPAMEVMSIVAYKQPLVKAEVDEIRGVESGHLLRALMDKSLVCFAGKSELPGKPMLYGTTRKFLETFSLKSLKDLPTLSEIDELIPEGIGDEEEKPTLDALTDSLSEEIGGSYSEGENELLKITDQLATIETSSEFFEQEKQRQREKRDADRAQNILEAIDVGEEVADKDRRWLERYQAAQEEALQEQEQGLEEAQEDASNQMEEQKASEVEDLDLVVDENDPVQVEVARAAVDQFESDQIESSDDFVVSEPDEEFTGTENNEKSDESEVAEAIEFEAHVDEPEKLDQI